MSQLVRPSIDYKESYLEALKEFQSEGRNLDYDIQKLADDFEGFVNKLLGLAEGKDLPEGFVPESKFWLVDKGEFIGTASIRHSLNENLLKIGGHIGYEIRPSKRHLGYGTEILKQALSEAKRLGIKNALITCDETNIGSRKIIESNGGVLEDIVFYDENMPKKMRFWIEING